MNESKEIKQYYKNNELDLENIIEDFTPYISKIIDNMARESLNNEDKEEIASDVFFILWKNKEKLNINNILLLYIIDKIDLLDSNVEEISKIEKTLSKMKIIDRTIFLDFYYSSKSIKDIAKEQNISEFNVKQRLYRIRNKIKKEVKENE